MGAYIPLLKLFVPAHHGRAMMCRLVAIVAVTLPLALTHRPICPDKYTCCCQYDAGFIPIMFHCVENEPNGESNCARDDRERLNFLEWMEDTCVNGTPNVTRTELEVKEEKEKEWQGNFTKYCRNNTADCSSTEMCFYDKRRDENGGSEYFSDLTMGPVCLCYFQNQTELGRANTDGTGECGVCKSVNGTATFVQRPANSSEGPGAKSFQNGEFACAHGLNSSPSFVELFV